MRDLFKIGYIVSEMTNTVSSWILIPTIPGHSNYQIGPKRCKSDQIRVLVKNLTSHGSLRLRQTTHACDTSLETASKMLHFDTIRKYVLQHTTK